MKEETKEGKEKSKCSHKWVLLKLSITLLTNRWKGIRIDVFRICNYSQKANQEKKKKKTNYFKHGDVNNV